MIEPPPILRGPSLHLRPLAREDLPTLVGWFNDRELLDLIGEADPIDLTQATRHFERTRADETRRWYGVELNESGQLIGEGGLLRLNPAWRCSDMSMILGEREARGRGYGTEAAELLIRLAFDRLGLHRLAIGVVGLNDRAIGFWRKLGFREEGVQRDGYRCRGEFHDFVMMSLLATDRRV